MRLGIFAKTFSRPALEETLDAVRAHGIDCIQFNMACAGLPSLPERISRNLCARIRQAAAARNIAIAAVSGTFNMIHPDPAERQQGLQRLRVLAGASAAMGTRIITICTGTRDPQNMWRAHPDNDSPLAWEDLTASLSEALRIADENDLVLAFEPEVANVIDTPRRARRLLHWLRSARLKVVLDPANLFRQGDVFRQRDIIAEAFDLLGPDIVLAHAKDFTQDPEIRHVAAGQGLLDYDYYIECLRGLPVEVPLILHGLEEAEVSDSLHFLRQKTIGLAPRKP